MAINIEIRQKILALAYARLSQLSREELIELSIQGLNKLFDERNAVDYYINNLASAKGKELAQRKHEKYRVEISIPIEDTYLKLLAEQSSTNQKITLKILINKLIEDYPETKWEGELKNDEIVKRPINVRRHFTNLNKKYFLARKTLIKS